MNAGPRGGVGGALFVDTGAWVAVANAGDDLHRRAADFYRQALSLYRRLATTELVLAESYRLLRWEFPTSTVLVWLDGILASPRVDIVYTDRALLDRARMLLAMYKDQDFSLTDAVSFVVMRDRRIREAFAFDRHFRAAGFRTLSE